MLPKFHAIRTLALGVLALAAVGCVQRPDAPPKSVVFFTNESSTIGPNARQALDEFARDARAVPNRRVLVEGYAGASSSPVASQQLSLARAKAVSDALIERGVDPSRIALQPRPPGSADPGLESRRVELGFAP